MTPRPIDDVRTDVLEAQAHIQRMRDDVELLWRHALMVTIALFLFGGYIWLSERR